MSKRRSKAPRWDWQVLGPDIDFAELLTDDLIRDLRRDLSVCDEQMNAFVRDLHLAASSYWFADAGQDQPTPAQIQSAIALAANRSGELANILDRLDERSRTWLQNEMANQNPAIGALQSDDEIPWENPENDYYEDLISKLRTVSNAGKHLLNVIPPSTKKGRPADEALPTFLLNLEGMYCEHTKTDARTGFSYDASDRKFDGPFFVFAEKCVRAIATNRTLSNNALGEAIRRSLGWRNS